MVRAEGHSRKPELRNDRFRPEPVRDRHVSSSQEVDSWPQSTKCWVALIFLLGNGRVHRAGGDDHAGTRAYGMIVSIHTQYRLNSC